MAALSASSGPDEQSVAAGLMRWLGGRFATMVLQFATVVVLARAVGPEGLGLAQFAFVVFGYAVVLNDLGLTTLGSREAGRVSTRLGLPGHVIGSRIVLSVPVILVLIVSAVAVGGWLATTALISLAAIAGAFNLRWLLQADRDFGRLAALEVAAAAVQFGAAVAVLSLGAGWLAGLAVLLSGPLILSLGSVAVAAARHGAAIIPSVGPHSGPLIRSAMPLGVASVVTVVYYSFDSLLLGLTRSPEDVGVYGAAYRIVLATLVLPVAAHGVALPIVARLTDSATKSISPLLYGVSVALLTVALPVAVATTLYADQIVALVFGPGFDSSAPILRLLIWSLVTVSANVPFAVLLLAQRRDRVYLSVTFAGAAVSVALDIALVPALGPVAAATITLIAEVSVLSLLIWHTRDVSVSILIRSIGLALPPAVGVLAGWLSFSTDFRLGLVLSLGGWLAAVGALFALGAYRGVLAILMSRTLVAPR